MIRISIEVVLIAAAYVAGILTHKWAGKKATDLTASAADAAKKI